MHWLLIKVHYFTLLVPKGLTLQTEFTECLTALCIGLISTLVHSTD